MLFGKFLIFLKYISYSTTRVSVFVLQICPAIFFFLFKKASVFMNTSLNHFTISENLFITSGAINNYSSCSVRVLRLVIFFFFFKRILLVYRKTIFNPNKNKYNNMKPNIGLLLRNIH